MRYSSFVSSFERQNNLLLHWQLREKRGVEMFPYKLATFSEKEKKKIVLTNTTTYLETFGFESLPDEEKLFLVLKKQWKVKGEIRKPIISRKQPRQNKNRVKGNSEKFLTSFLLCLPNCKIYFI